MPVKTEDLIFLGLNRQVIALLKKTGDIVWDWKAPEGHGYVSLTVLDEEHLIASVMGYTYCLNPKNGYEHWRNRLKGIPAGVTALATLGQSGDNHHLLSSADAIQAQQSQSSSAASSSTFR